MPFFSWLAISSQRSARAGEADEAGEQRERGGEKGGTDGRS